MKKTAIVIIMLLVILISDKTYITKITNKINTNLKIDKISFESKKYISIKRLKYKIDNLKINIQSLIIKIKQIKKNFFSIKITSDKIKIKILNIKANITQIKTFLIIKNKTTKITTFRINKQNTKEIIYKAQTFKTHNKITKKYTIIHNKNIIKNKNNEKLEVKVLRKNISTHIKLKKLIKNTKILIKKLKYKKINIKSMMMKINNSFTVLKFNKSKIIDTTLPKTKIIFLEKKNKQHISLKLKSKNIKIIIYGNTCNTHSNSNYIIKNINCYNTKLTYPTTTKINKDKIKINEFKIENIYKNNALIIKIIKKKKRGLIYIYYINATLPKIKMLTKDRNSCNIYIKGKFYKSLIYTKNIIKLWKK